MISTSRLRLAQPARRAVVTTRRRDELMASRVLVWSARVMHGRDIRCISCRPCDRSVIGPFSAHSRSLASVFWSTPSCRAPEPGGGWWVRVDRGGLAAASSSPLGATWETPAPPRERTAAPMPAPLALALVVAERSGVARSHGCSRPRIRRRRRTRSTRRSEAGGRRRRMGWALLKRARSNSINMARRPKGGYESGLEELGKPRRPCQPDPTKTPTQPNPARAQPDPA